MPSQGETKPRGDALSENNDFALVPKPPRTRLDAALYILDVTIVMWSAAILLWHFLIFPTANGAGKAVIIVHDHDIGFSFEHPG